ncbi:putative subtilisin-like protease-like [Capsicum annuum]|nr:putative subtilisin-like protease-like [Capsicum annuum]
MGSREPTLYVVHSPLVEIRDLSMKTVLLSRHTVQQRGIFVSVSAGNSGPSLRAVSNEAPWFLTVGASTHDRKLKVTVNLGNIEEFEGESAYHPKTSNSTFFTLYEAGKSESDRFGNLFCSPGTLTDPAIKGKIVVCRRSRGLPKVIQGKTVKDAGGPNVASPGILKSDLIGPGVNVLADWPTSVDNNKNTKSTFNDISGTSMACPHLSGIAALLKSAHPDWSPAAIKSATMTTADTFNFAKNPILDERLIPADIFAIGAGHVHPVRASDPGLIYDTPFADYVPYLCGLNYTNQEVGKLLQCNVNCLEVKSIPAEQLNYPSFSIKLGSTPQTYTRTVTNVGDAKSSYQVDVVSPKGVSVKVKPSKLNFSKLNQNLTYQVTFSNTTNSSKVEDVEGFLKWNSNRHSVRSPIAVTLSAK